MDINIIGYLIGNMIRVFLLYKVFRIFYEERKVSGFTEFIAYVIFYMINSTLYIKYNYPLVNICTNFFGMFIITFIYKGEFLKKIFVVIFSSVFEIIQEALGLMIISPNVCELLGNSQIIEAYQYLFIYVIRYPLVLVMEKCINSKKGYKILKTYWFSLCLVSLLSCVLYFIIMLSNMKEPIVMSGMVTLFCMNLTIFTLYDQIMKSKESEINGIYLKNQNMIYEEQLCIINDNIKKTKGIRHDIRNHLGVVRGLLIRNDTTDAIKYIDKYNEIISDPSDRVKTGDNRIDAIINYGLGKCQQANIQTNVNVKISNDIHIEPIDFMTIWGNLIDNAITAAGKCEDAGKIKIDIMQNGKIILIHMENNYVEIVKHGEKLITTKENTQEHGIGLKNVNLIVDKYNGSLTMSQQENLFIIDVILHEK